MTGFRAFGLRAALLVGALGGVAATNEAAAQSCNPDYTLINGDWFFSTLVNTTCRNVIIPSNINAFAIDIITNFGNISSTITNINVDGVIDFVSLNSPFGSLNITNINVAGTIDGQGSFAALSL